jgi:hypothetical protein
MKNLLVLALALCIAMSGCITIQDGVQPAVERPVIKAFSADPQVISSGAACTLSWTVTGANSISIDNGIGNVALSGSTTISPTATTTYVIMAGNAAGTSTAGCQVTVQGSAPGTPLPAAKPGPGAAGSTDLHLVINESGSLIKSGANYAKSGAVCAGDTPSNLPSRAFLSFDISSIPANASVQEAVLDLGTYAITGNPIYSVSGWGNMGALEVYQYQYGPNVDTGRLGYDFPAPSAGSFKLTDTSTSPLKMDVTLDNNGNNTIEKLLSAGQSRCQFRLQFFTTTNWDSKADLVCMETAVLRVRYSVPK